MSVQHFSDRDLKTRIIREAWENQEFKKKLLANPKVALTEIGVSLPAEFEIVVEEENSKKMILVLPPNPIEATSEILSSKETESNYTDNYCTFTFLCGC